MQPTGLHTTSGHPLFNFVQNFIIILGDDEEDDIVYEAVTRKEDGMNVLGLVVFSVALGIVISKMGEVGKPLYRVFFAMAEATMVLVTVIIWQVFHIRQ